MLVVDHKLYLFHHRTHHFLTGLVIAVIGIGLMFHDRRDWRVAFHDFCHLESEATWTST